MATDQALSCADVVALICSQCNKRTLASLACTRKDISEIALDALWYSIPNIGLLIRCMPEDLWEEEEAEDDDEEAAEEIPDKLVSVLSAHPSNCSIDRQTFRRSILPTDWNRFEINAIRIRRFGHPDSSITAYTVGIDVYAALACASVGKTPLLPRLTDICWSKWTGFGYSYINLFVLPSIQKCTFDVTGTSGTSVPLLQLSLLPPLVSACPHMTHLSLYGLSRAPWQDIEKVLSTLRRWSSLWFLELRDLPDASMLCMAKLPVLRELIIKNSRETGEEHLPMHVKGFTKLESLNIVNASIEFPVELITCMSRTPLQTLRLEFGRDPEAGELSNLFMAMRRNISQSSLRNLHIDYVLDKAELVEEERSITLDELSPLLTFTNLSDVSIALNYEFRLDKEDLRIITSSWPHLQTLALSSLRPSQYWPLTSINDFTYFLGHCPSLESLTIAFDASEACLGTGKPGGGVCYEKIHTLGVLHSPIGDPGKVAAFLSDIFPNLQEIRIFCCEELELPGDYEELEQKWEEVERLVKVFSLVRTQEKMFRL